MGHQSGLHSELRKVSNTVSLSFVFQFGTLCQTDGEDTRCDEKDFVNNQHLQIFCSLSFFFLIFS